MNADDCGNDGELTDEYVSEINKLISEQKKRWIVEIMLGPGEEKER